MDFGLAGIDERMGREPGLMFRTETSVSAAPDPIDTACATRFQALLDKLSLLGRNNAGGTAGYL